MIDIPSKRVRLLSWIKSSHVLAPVKILIPDILKRGVLGIVAGGKQGTISLGDGSILKYNLDDSYWARHARDIRAYEPEMWFVADHYLKSNTIFVDCGANIGLWSCYAASKIKNRDQVIAVEPGDSILPLLRQNHALNGATFTLLENAVWNRSGETKTFIVHRGHASSSLVEEDSDNKPVHRASVLTISIDDIVRRALEKAPSAVNVVVKLDVEGVERQALDGALHTLSKKNMLFIYEDHGRDLASETTTHFLNTGLNIYFIDDTICTVRAITNSRELCGIKTNPGKGYNFIACKPSSEFDKEFFRLCRGMAPKV